MVALSNAEIGEVISDLLNASSPEQVRHLLRLHGWLVSSTEVDSKLTQVIANGYRAPDMPSVAIYSACRGFLRRCRSAGQDAALAAQPGWPLARHAPLLQLLAFDESTPPDLLVQHAQAALGDIDPETEGDVYGLIRYYLGLGYQEQAERGSNQALDLAIDNFEAAAQAWQQQGAWFGHSFMGRAQHNLGRLYWKRRRGNRTWDMETALGWLKRALATTQDESLERRNVLILMGDAYLHRIIGGRLENIECAIYYYGEAQHLVQQEKNRHPAEQGQYEVSLAGIEHNLAVAYRMRLSGDRSENYERAKELAECAWGRLDRKTHPEDWSRTAAELATIYNYRERGNRDSNLEAAIGYAQQALKVYDPDRHTQQWTLVQLTLGNLYCDRISGSRAQNDRRAVRCFRNILERCDRESDPLRWAEAMNNLGTVYATQSTSPSDHNYRKAIACFRGALEVRTPQILPAQALQTVANLGNLDFHFGRWEQASDAFQIALQAGEVLYRASATAPGRRAELAETWRLVARIAYCLLRLERPSEALLKLEQGKTRLLADALVRLKLSDSQQTTLLELQQAIHDLETEMRLPPETSGRRSYAELSSGLAQARADIDQLLKDAGVEPSGFPPVGSDASWILRLIPEHGALVAPAVTSQGSAAFVLPAGIQRIGMEHVIFLDAFSDRELDALLIGSQERPGWLPAYTAWRAGGALQDWKRVVETYTGRLWEVLMEPVHARLSGLGLGQGAPVTLLPQGGLSLLPLHAAWRQVDGAKRAFLDDYSVSYAPSAFALNVIRHRLQDERRHRPSLLAVVNPTGDLLFASHEGNAVTQLFLPAAQLLAEGEATQAAVLQEAPGRTYLHFACHGSYGWQDVMQSALVLARGHRFTLSEIASGLGLESARLVTLSACETGLSEFQQTPDEYIGLPAAFLQVGVPEMVSSLWAVDDLSTALLMVRFYQHHLKDGLSTAQALRAAQRGLRQEVDRLTVIDLIHSLLCELEEKQRNLPAYSEVAYVLSRHIHRLRQLWDGLLKQEGSDAESHPFDHPYYWAAFTVWSPNIDITGVKPS